MQSDALRKLWNGDLVTLLGRDDAEPLVTTEPLLAQQICNYSLSINLGNYDDTSICWVARV